MGRKLAFVLLIGALPLTGCTAEKTGTPATTKAAAVQQAKPAQLTSAAALGDIKTVSPCSLIDEKALPKPYGKGVLIAADNLDDCALSVPQPGGAPVIATLGILEKLAKPAARTMPRAGGMRIARLRDEAGRCEELLVFADDVAMHATTRPSGGQRTGLCDLATVLLDQVVKTVTGKGPRHRDYPDYSFSGMDACKLLSGTEGKLAGIGSLHQAGDFPAHHRCVYGSGGAQVELDFGVRDPASWDPQWTEVQLGSRDSLVVKDGPTSCVVSTAWFNLADAGPKGTTESADLTVRVPSGRPAPCAQAKKVATAVWKKLP